MAKTYRFDPDNEDTGGFHSRKELKLEKKRVKEDRRRKAQEQERMDGGAETIRK